MGRRLLTEVSVFVGLLTITVYAIALLASRIRDFFSTPQVALLVLLALVAMFFAQSLNRQTLGYSFVVTKLLLNAEFRGFKGLEPIPPVVLVTSTYPFGNAYALRIASYMSGYLQQRKPLIMFIPLNILEMFSDEIQRGIIDRSLSAVIVRAFFKGSPESQIPAENIALKTIGKIYEIDVNMDGATTLKRESSPDTYRFERVPLAHSVGFLDATQLSELKVISQDMSTSMTVIDWELRQLGTSGQSLSSRVLRDGLQPLARLYGRFFVASSDTERLLALFDCFEGLVKLCSVTLIGCAAQKGISIPERAFPEKEGKTPRQQSYWRLSFGDWIRLLGEGVKESGGSVVERNIADFLSSRVQDGPLLELVTVAARNGMAGPFEGGRHEEWLGWLERVS